ncbi:MAG: hypothetical protein PSV35_00745 [bacterium]|nr:hypothetical protein [bacterium]
MRQAIKDKINADIKKAKVNLAHLQITDEEIEDIIKEIYRLEPNVSVIKLDNNQLSDKGALVLKDCLHEFSQLTKLDLQFNHIDRDGAIAVFGLIKELDHLEILFHGNKITDAGDMENIKTTALNQQRLTP